MLVHAPDPRLEARVFVAEHEELAQNQMELHGVGLVEDQRVLEEWEGRTVGRRETAEQIVPPCEQLLEHVERGR